MNRAVLAAFALLLASHGCAADDHSTTMEEERRLTDTTVAETPDDVSGAVARSGGVGPVLLALLAFTFVGNAAAAALDESTTMADDRRLMDTTMAETPDDVSGAVARSGSLGTLLLALLAFLFVGNAAGAAVDESTTMADERRLTDTTMAETPDDVSGAPRAALRTSPVLALAAALGLAARR